MVNWYLTTIVSTGRQPLFFALIAFVLTVVTTRTITRLIRSGRGPFKNISTGDVHVHHMVPGMVCLLLGGFLALAAHRHGVMIHVAGILFGMGAALVLDEFALILHLEDVYWEKEGKASADAVAIMLALMTTAIWMVSPDNPPGPPETDPYLRVVGPLFIAVIWWIPVGITVLKGKLFTAAISLLLPMFSWVAAIRLARPGSPWARLRYGKNPRKAQLARQRYDAYEAKAAPIRRWWDEHIFGFASDDQPAPAPITNPGPDIAATAAPGPPDQAAEVTTSEVAAAEVVGAETLAPPDRRSDADALK